MDDKIITPDTVFIWRCAICGETIGVVRPKTVRIRIRQHSRQRRIEAMFPVLQFCVRCNTWNYCAGPMESLTGSTPHGSLDDSFLQTLPAPHNNGRSV
jgi:hypothetical protein